MKPSTGTACLVSVLKRGALTCLACERQLRGRNKLLKRFRSALESTTDGTVCCIPALMDAKIKSRYVGFWRSVESARQSAISSQFLVSSILSSELDLWAEASCLVEGCSNDPFSSVSGVYLTVATECSSVSAWLLEVDEVLSWICVFAPSSG